MRRRLLMCAVVAACGRKGDSIDWLRMKDQTSMAAKDFAATDAFPDGAVMHAPPAGTVPRDRVLGRPLYTEGVQNGVYAMRPQIPVTRQVLERGRERFQIVCAACHGQAADGDSEVGRNMKLRRPPSLVADAARALPAGRIFSVATHGYGLMPSYADMLGADDRWAVVAYVQTLQLGAAVPVDRLADEDRAALEKIP